MSERLNLRQEQHALQLGWIVTIFRFNDLIHQGIQFSLRCAVLLRQLVSLPQLCRIIDIEVSAVVDIGRKEFITITQSAACLVDKCLRFLEAFLDSALDCSLRLEVSLDLLLIERISCGYLLVCSDH